MHGQGMFQWSDRRTHQGTYCEGKKHGYGVYSWPDGRKYEGKFLNGQ